jgi:hypothetical protein
MHSRHHAYHNARAEPAHLARCSHRRRHTHGRQSAGRAAGCTRPPCHQRPHGNSARLLRLTTRALPSGSPAAPASPAAASPPPPEALGLCGTPGLLTPDDFAPLFQRVSQRCYDLLHETHHAVAALPASSQQQGGELPGAVVG